MNWMKSDGVHFWVLEASSEHSLLGLLAPKQALAEQCSTGTLKSILKPAMRVINQPVQKGAKSQRTIPFTLRLLAQSVVRCLGLVQMS
jgi:hypothetical protein